MKILFVGQLGEGQTSRMRMEVLAELGHEIIPYNSQTAWSELAQWQRLAQQKARRGAVITRLNAAILRLARAHRPDLLWAEKQEYLWPSTLEQLRVLGVRSLHFTPDPYFSLAYKRTSLADKCLSLYDFVVTCKRYEMDEYRHICRQVIYMPLGYAEAVHRPISPADAQVQRVFKSDVGFLGAWEPRREELLEAIAQTGCSLKIWGYSWDHLIDGKWTPRRAWRLRMLAGEEPFRIHKNEQLGRALQGGEVYGDAYAWALSGAKISVGFLRHVCPDQHTTRTFEIPACGSMMIADRTGEHQEFFEEGKEAEFFDSQNELIDKVNFYLKNENARMFIARAGWERGVRSGYSYRQRLLEVLSQIS